MSSVRSKCGNWSFGRDEQYYKASDRGDLVVVGNEAYVDFIVDQYEQMHADASIQRESATYAEFEAFCKSNGTGLEIA